MLQNENATQSQIDAEAAALEKAMENLKRKPDVPSDENSSDNQQDKPGQPVTPETGIADNMILLVTLFLTGAVLTVTNLKRKNKND